MFNVITIPREFIKEKELVLVPRNDYEELLEFRAQIEQEERDTDEAIMIFKQEKKTKKLITIKSLADLD
jgi:hypothetical protein